MLKICRVCFRKFQKKGKFETLCLRCFNKRKKLGKYNFDKLNRERKIRRATLINRICRIINKSEFIHPTCRCKVIEEIRGVA